MSADTIADKAEAAAVWGEHALKVGQIHEEIKRAFDEHEIEIPFPHRTLYTGAVTEPLPIEIVTGRSGAELPST